MLPYCKKIPGSKINHHAVHVFNKHHNMIDVLDSKDWPTRSSTETTRSEFHVADVKEIECSQDWKAEFMYTVFFHPENKVLLDDIPEEIQCLFPELTLCAKEEELLQLFSKMKQ